MPDADKSLVGPPERAWKDLPALLRAEDVAEILTVDREWVMRNFKVGRVRLGHRTTRFRKADVLGFLRSVGAGE